MIEVLEKSNRQLCDMLREREAQAYNLAVANKELAAERDRWVERVRVLEARLEDVRRALG